MIVAAALLAGGGCGGSTSPLQQVSNHLADIHSADLALRFSLTPSGAKEGVGVRLAGPFSLSGTGPLPVARIAYSQQVGVTRRATFISNGERAFVSTGGRTVRLPSTRLAGLRVGSGQKRSLDDLGVHVERWVRDAKTTAGPRLDGHATERITGRLNGSQALGELVHASGGAGALSSADAKRLARTVSASSVGIVAGKDDHLLRRLRLSVHLAVPPDLRRSLGGRVGLRVAVSLSLSKVNRPVHVSMPGSVGMTVRRKRPDLALGADLNESPRLTKGRSGSAM